MSKHENHWRSLIVAELHPLLAFPVENSVANGTPDICCTHGWIELKLAVDVERDDKTLKIKVRPAQRLWMKRWREANAPGWFLTRVDGDHPGASRPWWALHDGRWGASHLGRSTRREFIASATLLSTRSVPSYAMMGAAMQKIADCVYDKDLPDHLRIRR